MFTMFRRTRTHSKVNEAHSFSLDLTTHYEAGHENSSERRGNYGGRKSDAKKASTSSEPQRTYVGLPSNKEIPNATRNKSKRKGNREGGELVPRMDRYHTDFPAIDPIAHLQRLAGIKYNYRIEMPQGYRTPEIFKWSLHKNDWFHIYTHDDSLTTLVSRTMLYEMGIDPSELPPVTNEEDLEEAAGLPSHPVCIEGYHYEDGHGPQDCYWPEMTSESRTMPKLDRSLPYPIDFLMVHDPDNISHLFDGASVCNSVSSDPLLAQLKIQSKRVRYRRVDPNLIGIPCAPLPPKMPVMASLQLCSDCHIGSGHTADVWGAVLDVPYFFAQAMFERCYRPDSPWQTLMTDHILRSGAGFYRTSRPGEIYGTSCSPFSGVLPTQFTVAAKVTDVGYYSRDYCDNEAKMYGAIPTHLAQDWSGYQLVPPLRLPQPACAIVPKTYGYFVPDVTYGRLSNGMSVAGKEHQLCPILLMEQCGTPVDVNRLSPEHKKICYSMLERLHWAGFAQHSMANRNFLVQPGPLRVAPELRSMQHPSFRLIDFGRGKQRRDDNHADFKRWCKEDMDKMSHLLGYGMSKKRALKMRSKRQVTSGFLSDSRQSL